MSFLSFFYQRPTFNVWHKQCFASIEDALKRFSTMRLIENFFSPISIFWGFLLRKTACRLPSGSDDNFLNAWGKDTVFSALSRFSSRFSGLATRPDNLVIRVNRWDNKREQVYKMYETWNFWKCTLQGEWRKKMHQILHHICIRVLRASRTTYPFHFSRR